MTDEELNRSAFASAQKALQTKFDWQAYILLYVVEERLKRQNTKPQDKETETKYIDIDIPDTDIDDNMRQMMDCFIQYFKDRSLKGLECCMAQCKKIVSELLHMAETQEEIDIVRRYIDMIAKI